MKYKPSVYLKKFPQWLEAVIFKHLLIVSILIAASANLLLFLVLHIEARDILPYVITFEASILTLLGIVFALAMGIKDGAVYNVLRSKDVNLICSAYWRIFFCCLTSTLTILIGILILCVHSWTVIWVRMAVQTAGLVCFIYSVFGTLHLLYYFTFLMINDAKRT